MCNQTVIPPNVHFIIFAVDIVILISLKTNTLLMVIKGKEQDCGSIIKILRNLNYQRNTAIDHAPCECQPTGTIGLSFLQKAP